MLELRIMVLLYWNSYGIMLQLRIMALYYMYRVMPQLRIMALYCHLYGAISQLRIMALYCHLYGDNTAWFIKFPSYLVFNMFYCKMKPQNMNTIT
jgi:hypothetical protein